MVTKTDCKDALRRVLLAQASHIALAREDKEAASFLGVEESEITSLNPNVIDLSRFTITSQIEMARLFTWYPETAGAASLEEHDFQDVVSYINGRPQYDWEGNYIDAAVLDDVRDGMVARAKIHECEVKSGGFGGAFPTAEPLTPRELALLGNLSERAVRNAIARHEIELTATSLEGEAAVPPERAYRWLLNRRGFKPWPDADTAQHLLIDQALQATKRQEFAETVSEIVRRVKPSSLPEGAEQVLNGSFGVDPQLLSAVADALRLPDKPAFVGQAVTLALREERD